MVVDPMLATTGSLPEDEERWSFEPKWDGFRAIVHTEGRRLRVLSRRGTDLVARLPELAQLTGVLAADTVLDGELVVLDIDGRVDFEGVDVMKRASGSAASGPSHRLPNVDDVDEG